MTEQTIDNGPTEVAEQTQQVAEYQATQTALAELREKFGNTVWNLQTVAGNKEARQVRAQLVSLRTGLEARRKAIKEPVLALAKLIDTEARRITAEVVAIEKPIDEAIQADEKRRDDERKAKEAAEAARVAAIVKRLRDLSSVALEAAGRSALVISTKMADVEAIVIDESWGEYQATATATKADTLAQLARLRDAALANEEEARRLAAERAEFERAQAEAKRAAEKSEAERVEAQRKAQAEADRIAELQRQQQADLAAQQAALAAQAADLERQREEQAALSRRIQAEEDERKRQSEAEAARIQATFDAQSLALVEAHADANTAPDVTPATVEELGEFIDGLAEFMATELEPEDAALDVEFVEPTVVPVPGAVGKVTMAAPRTPKDRPTDDELLEAIVLHFRVHEMVAIGWLLEMDLKSLAAREAAAFT